VENQVQSVTQDGPTSTGNSVDEKSAPPTAIAENTSGQSAGRVIIADEYLDDSSVVPENLLAQLPETIVGQIPEERGAINVAKSSENAAASDLARLLETSADQSSRITAFRTLARVWNTSLPSTLLQPACQSIENDQLSCTGLADWPTLLRYNRPAILVLTHGNQLHRVVLQSINEDFANILIADQSLSVPVAELRERWNGSGVIFWRAPDTSQRFLQPGDIGTDIEVAREIVNRALNAAQLPLLASATSDEFDMDMAQKVFALQTRFNILADGKIGNETWLLIHELLDSDTPVLQPRV
jgi:hypothetical protein